MSATPGENHCRTLLAVSLPDLAVDAERLRDACIRYGVARLEVFGSVGRGNPSPGSDIDVLYELEPGAQLGWEIEDLATELSALLGRPVDLVARDALHELIRDEVLSESRLLYAA